MASTLPPFPSFDPNPELGAPGTRWKKYVARFKNLIIALDITDTARQKALLLHFAGEEVSDILDILPEATADKDEDPLEKAIDALTDYFQPKQNLAYEEYQFRQAKQGNDEAFMAFYTRLRQLAVTCEFGDLDREIKSQIILKCFSTKLRRKALSSPDMKLEELLREGKAMELAEQQARTLEKSSDSQHHVNKFRGGKQNNSRSRSIKTDLEESRKTSTSKCRNCDRSYPHRGGRTSCPAYGKQCRKCGKMNHFQAVCRSEPTRPNIGKSKRTPGEQHRVVRNVNEDSESDEHDLFNITVHSLKQDNTKHTLFDVEINGTKMSVMADSGSSINILDEHDYQRIQPRPVLKSTHVDIFAYNSKSRLPVIGNFVAEIMTTRGVKAKEDIYVVKGSSGSLLSWSTSQKLRLITTTTPLKSVNTNGGVDSLVAEYSDLFVGLGKLKGYQVKLHIDDSVTPVAQPHRRIPFHVRKQLEEQLEKDEQQGVIERVDGPTPWVSPVVVAPKPKQPGKIRMCVDMRRANQAIQRERHITPTVREIIGDLNGARIFTKLDLNQGYNQLELAPDSRYITTFSTHLGLRRFTRLNFGVSSAAEIFQNVIRETLSGIPGVTNISDDILVYGSSQEDHDRALASTFQRLRERGLTLNPEKCVYSQSSLGFFGYVFSDQGISADPEKVEEIINLEVPSNASEVRSLLGMTNYCSRFIPDYATLTQPLRQLIQKNTPWKWTPLHEQALAKLKDALTTAPVTAYFDPNKYTEICVDASPVGVAAILTQTDQNGGNRHVVAYASRSLSDTEQRYSQTEREALAVVWACEYFHLYIYGKPVTIYTDHKPLVAIYGNPQSKPPARIERWALRLQPYQITVVYKKGESNPADYISRHPSKCKMATSRQGKVAEEFVDYLVQTSTPNALKLEDIQSATQKDQTLQAVIEAIQTGNWHKPGKRQRINTVVYNAMEKVKDELTVCLTYDIILRGTRIVIPEDMQKHVVDLAHEGHQGIVKTKALLREKVWFAGINDLTEKKVKSCITCQAATPDVRREPLKMSPLPDTVWQEVSVDFKELSTGGYLLVITDDYSRYPVVDVVRSVSAAVVIPHMDKIFAEYGVPVVVKSDNGPPFNGRDFKQFADTLGFRHRKITPLWPRSNGEVERFMRTLKKVIEAARTENRSWKEELCKFLRNYRATPHCSTGQAPATVLFNRPMRTKLPEGGFPTTPDPARIRERDEQAKKKMKKNADNKVYVKPSNFSKGDKVIVRRDPSHKKSTTPYDPTPYFVIERKGSMVTASRDDRTITRNSSFFKPISVEGKQVAESPQTFETPNDGHNEESSRRYPLRSSRRPPERFKEYVK